MTPLTQKQGEILRAAAGQARLQKAMAKIKAKKLEQLTNAEITLLEGTGWSGRTGYEQKLAHLERKRDLSDKITTGPKDRERRKACEFNLELFARTYLRAIFSKPFGRGHKRILRNIAHAVLHGGRDAVGMSRGFGKTSLSIAGATWALVYGHRRFFVFVSAEQTLAEQGLQAIKDIILENDLLAEDFPEICAPIRLAKGSGMRVRHYTWKGTPIRMEWRKRVVALPVGIPGASAAGAVVQAYGITARLRGANKLEADGSMARPDFAIIDDFQTDESAHSKEQCRTRIGLVRNAILQMAGHERRMSVLGLCTPIVKDDAADQLLNDPTWQVERIPFVLAWPKSMELWEEYFKIRQRVLGQDQQAREATKFYRGHRASMDAGAEVSWEHAHDKKAGEISALQHAMNILCDTPDAFWAEYQMAPRDSVQQMYVLTQEAIISKTTAIERWSVPEAARLLVLASDVNRSGLHWVAAGFDQAMSPHLANYGKWPEHGDLWAENAPEMLRKQAIFEGLAGLAGMLGKATWLCGQKPLRPALFASDRGFEPEVVHRFCTVGNTPFRTIPTRGYAAHKYSVRKTELIGQPMEQCHVTQSRLGPYLAFNADYWREIAQRSFLGAMGSPGTATLYKADPRQHVWLADHLLAEILRQKYQTDQGPRWEWVMRPGRINDLLDALTIAFVLAAWSGLNSSGLPGRPAGRRRPGGVTVIPL